MQRIVIALIALGYVMLGSAPAHAAATALPAGVQAAVNGYAAQCRKLGGSLTGRLGIMTADLDGDGRPDYALNSQPLQCSAAATAFCGNGGCQVSIALSTADYRRPITDMGGQPTLVQAEDGTRVELWVDGTNCKLTTRDRACWVSYAWAGGKLGKTYRARALPN